MPPVRPLGAVALSDEQHRAIKGILAQLRTQQSTTLGGYAGTGKSTVITHLIRLLPGYRVLAYTGKAVNVLRSKGVQAATIHSALYNPREISWVEEGVRHIGVEFDDKDSVSGAGFIVDEASMVDRSCHDDLLNLGRPVIFVGDHGQLPPVTTDVGSAAFALLLNPDFTLTTLHRNAGEIARFAEFLRCGGEARDWPCYAGADGSQVNILPPEAGDALLRDHTTSLPDQLLCAYNATRVGLNRVIRQRLEYPPDSPTAGDRITCLQNDHRLGIFNGMQGTIAYLRDDLLHFATVGHLGSERVVPVRYLPSQFHAERKPPSRDPLGRLPFDYAYALTVHKSQGDEWSHVLVYEQRCRHWEHARWAYTAASRARERLTWVLED